MADEPAFPAPPPEQGPRPRAAVGKHGPGPTGNRVRRASFPVARIAGIEIRVHLTFLLLLALFAGASNQAGFSSPWLAMAWVVAIFACVVVHELAHSLVARRRGGEVHEILLMPLGGISKLERLPERPADEFAIAIVGPLASLGLAAGFAILAAVTGRALVPIDLLDGSWLARLAWLNLLLAVFNMLPAFPLDGGRVFRSLLERRMSLEAATRVATRVGHALAGAIIAIGFFFDAWLALIGIFVYFGATAEERATIVHIRLAGHRVGEIMRIDLDRVGLPDGVTTDGAVGPQDLLSDEVVAAVAQAPDHQIAVVAHGKLVGVLRLEDIERLVAAAEPR